jgi:DNA uptake protein ComE-like DNA-binding protein
MKRVRRGAWIGIAVLAMLLSRQSASAQVGKSTGMFEPNLATKEQLTTLPGVTAALADAIIAGRPYRDMLAFHAAHGSHIAEAQRTELYRKLFMPINLNATTREEIMLVPGMTARMAHEFEEYRPYDGLARFRREIGKYVDAAEVARLEQYVFVPIPLNTANDADIMSIPGMTPRMLHEFKEYRPYDRIERFRREIGKYVDANEVARLERYVVVR